MGDWIREYAVCGTASKLVGPRNKYHQLAMWPDMQCVSLGKGGGSDSSKFFLYIAVNYIPSHHSHRRRLVRGIVSRPIEPKWVKILQRFLQGYFRTTGLYQRKPGEPYEMSLINMYARRICQSLLFVLPPQLPNTTARTILIYYRPILFPGTRNKKAKTRLLRSCTTTSS